MCFIDFTCVAEGCTVSSGLLIHCLRFRFYDQVSLLFYIFSFVRMIWRISACEWYYCFACEARNDWHECNSDVCWILMKFRWIFPWPESSNKHVTQAYIMNIMHKYAHLSRLVWFIPLRVVIKTRKWCVSSKLSPTCKFSNPQCPHGQRCCCSLLLRTGHVYRGIHRLWCRWGREWTLEPCSVVLGCHAMMRARGKCKTAWMGLRIVFVTIRWL